MTPFGVQKGLYKIDTKRGQDDTLGSQKMVSAVHNHLKPQKGVTL